MKINWETGTNMTQRSCLAVVMAYVLFTGTAGWGEQYYQYVPKPVPAEDKQAGGEGILVKEISIQHGDNLYNLSRKFSGKGVYYPQILLFNDIKDPNKIYTGDLIKIPLSSTTLQENASASAPTKSSHHIKKTNSLLKNSHKKNLHAIPNVSKTLSTSHQNSGTVELSISDLQGLDDKSKKTKIKNKRLSRADKKATQSVSHRLAQSEKVVKQERLPEISNITSSEDAQVAPSSAQKTFERALKAFRQDNCSSALELFDRFLNENPSSPLAADANLYKAECYLKQSGL